MSLHFRSYLKLRTIVRITMFQLTHLLFILPGYIHFFYLILHDTKLNGIHIFFATL